MWNKVDNSVVLNCITLAAVPALTLRSSCVRWVQSMIFAEQTAQETLLRFSFFTLTVSE